MRPAGEDGVALIGSGLHRMHPSLGAHGSGTYCTMLLVMSEIKLLTQVYLQSEESFDCLRIVFACKRFILCLGFEQSLIFPPVAR